MVCRNAADAMRLLLCEVLAKSVWFAADIAPLGTYGIQSRRGHWTKLNARSRAVGETGIHAL
jgi:hypothetical protein